MPVQNEIPTIGAMGSYQDSVSFKRANLRLIPEQFLGNFDGQLSRVSGKDLNQAVRPVGRVMVDQTEDGVHQRRIVAGEWRREDARKEGEGFVCERLEKRLQSVCVFEVAIDVLIAVLGCTAMFEAQLPSVIMPVLQRRHWHLFDVSFNDRAVDQLGYVARNTEPKSLFGVEGGSGQDLVIDARIAASMTGDNQMCHTALILIVLVKADARLHGNIEASVA